jgi:hypothetical protein
MGRDRTGQKFNFLNRGYGIKTEKNGCEIEKGKKINQIFHFNSFFFTGEISGFYFKLPVTYHAEVSVA